MTTLADRPVQAPSEPASLIGRRVPGRMNRQLAAGRGEYVNDIVLAGTAHLAFLYRNSGERVRPLLYLQISDRGRISGLAAFRVGDGGSVIGEHRCSTQIVTIRHVGTLDDE